MKFQRLRSRIILSFCVLMIAGGAGTTLIVRYTLSNSMLVAARERGEVVAEIMAEQLAEPIMNDDWAKAQLVIDTESDHNAFVVVETNHDLTLIGVPRRGRLPAEVSLVVGRRMPSTIDPPIGPALDVPAPIHGGELGTVHIGVSLEPVFATTDKVVRQVIATTIAAMLAGIAGIFFMSGLITRPIGRLAEAARRMGGGDLETIADVRGGEEIASLAEAFNQMAGQVRERIAASDSLRAYYERILVHLSKAVVVCDAAGTIEYANRAAQNELGIRIGAAVSEVFSEGHVLGPLPPRSSLKDGQVARLTRHAPDGRSFAIAVATIPSAGKDSALVVSATEVTELTLLAARLRRTERIAVAGEVASGIVHAINNPLDGVHRAVDLARRQAGNQEYVEQMLSMAVEGTERIAQITRSLLTFARADETGSQVLVEAHDVLAAAKQLVSLRADELGVAIRLEVATGTPKIRVDPRALIDVVVNLLSNALDVAPPASTINASARKSGDHRVQLAISDSGPGIAPELRQRVFEPFFTTKDARRGTGLGLSMARRIVEAHGGEIELSCPASGGAVFAVLLPTADAPVNGAE